MTKIQEIWKDVPGYEGEYQASSLGRVKSFKHSLNGRIMNPSDKSGKYLKLDLYKRNKSKSISVHKIIAITFLGDTEGLTVDHINNNSRDNRLINLQLITHRQNNIKDKKNSTGFIGVNYLKHNKKWQASIYINRNNKYLGCYDSIYDAAKAYQDELFRINSLK